MNEENIEDSPLAIVQLYELDGRDALAIMNYRDYSTGTEIAGNSMYGPGTLLYIHCTDEEYAELNAHCNLQDFSIYDAFATITVVTESSVTSNGVAFIRTLNHLNIVSEADIEVKLHPIPMKLKENFPSKQIVATNNDASKIEVTKTEKPKLSGGLVNYYLVTVTNPQRVEQPAYQAECEDIIRALDMTFDEGCEFKAIWRTAAARMGNGKPGQQAIYDAEKRAHYANASLRQYRERSGE